MPILLEKPGRHPGQLAGRSPYLQAVHIDGAGYQIGDMVNVTIDAVGGNSLSAHIRSCGMSDSRPEHAATKEHRLFESPRQCP